MTGLTRSPPDVDYLPVRRRSGHDVLLNHLDRYLRHPYMGDSLVLLEHLYRDLRDSIRH